MISSLIYAVDVLSTNNRGAIISCSGCQCFSYQVIWGHL